MVMAGSGLWLSRNLTRITAHGDGVVPASVHPRKTCSNVTLLSSCFRSKGMFVSSKNSDYAPRNVSDSYRPGGPRFAISKRRASRYVEAPQTGSVVKLFTGPPHVSQVTDIPQDLSQTKLG